MSKTIDAQLREVHMAIEGALENPAIMSKLSKFGYIQKVLQEGSALVKEVKRLRTWQDEGYGMLIRHPTISVRPEGSSRHLHATPVYRPP